MKLNRGAETIEELEWQTKSCDELKKLSNKELAKIVKAYGRPYSGKRKDVLITAVQMVPDTEVNMAEL